jgi:tRNA-2-methylthio-N6-dimethylallyladenosine synthase
MQELKTLSKEEIQSLDVPRISGNMRSEKSKGKVYIESYGCQMNFADSEVVTSILMNHGYGTTDNIQESDSILLNTCAIRENSETKIRHRLI